MRSNIGGSVALSLVLTLTWACGSETSAPDSDSAYVSAAAAGGSALAASAEARVEQDAAPRAVENAAVEYKASAAPAPQPPAALQPSAMLQPSATSQPSAAAQGECVDNGPAELIRPLKANTDVVELAVAGERLIFVEHHAPDMVTPFGFSVLMSSALDGSDEQVLLAPAPSRDIRGLHVAGDSAYFISFRTPNLANEVDQLHELSLSTREVKSLHTFEVNEPNQRVLGVDDRAVYIVSARSFGRLSRSDGKLEQLPLAGEFGTARMEGNVVWYLVLRPDATPERPLGFYQFDATAAMPVETQVSDSAFYRWTLVPDNIVMIEGGWAKIAPRSTSSLGERTVLYSAPSSELVDSRPVFSNGDDGFVYWSMSTVSGKPTPLRSVSLRDYSTGFVSCDRRDISLLATSDDYIFWREDRRSAQELADNGLYRIAKPR